MASSDSTCDRQWKYDVFLSFRGVDTGKTFTDHLYTALDENGFYAFRDDEKHEKGEEIPPELLTAIKESRFSIVVFSKNYAASSWCLDELETIIKSMKNPGRRVMPVFYDVDPSEVQNQTGSYGKAFFSHERDADEEKKKERVERWRAALREASNLVGWHLQNQYEPQLIKEIITDILRRLNCELLQVDYDTFGMESYLKKLLLLINLKLNKVLMIGIYGISGIDKTTIAKAVYNKISYHFQSTIFSRGHDLNLTQLIQQLLDDTSMGTLGGTKNARVLVVVDDVDQLSQVRCLLELRDTLRDSFSLQSRIILTTSDKNLLNVAEVDAAYEAGRLIPEEAIHLFSWHAFKQTFPTEDCVDLVNHVVEYVDGHPLALKVLGFRFDKTITEWKCILHELRKNTHGEIYNVLKVSFVGRTPSEEEIFLKVVCLLNGKDEELVSTIQDNLMLGAESGIQVLHDRCLVTISNYKLYMHDLLQQMGQKLNCESNPKEPGKRGRLQGPEDVYPSIRNTGTEEIQRMFSSAGFQKMPKLYSRKHLPLKSLPPNSPGDSLILLNLSCSNIRQLWKGNKILGKLEFMDLSYCQNLIKISKFSSMPILKILTLKGCKKLRSLPSSISELKCLERLRCSGCSKLELFPEITGKMQNLKELHLDETTIKGLPTSIENLTALKVLNLEGCESLASLPSCISELKHLKSLQCSGCSKLETFPEIKGKMENLKELHLDETTIKQLPSSIENLTALEVFNLECCKKLASLPSGISELKNLESLLCFGCSKLERFPEITGEMENLKVLHLGRTAIKELPSSIEYLTALEVLNLELCESLASLPSGISELKHLKCLRCSGCLNLERFPEITGKMENLKELHLAETAIEELPSSIENLIGLEVLNLAFCKSLASLPTAISELKHLKSLWCSGCSDLESFPEITGKMEHLKELHLNWTSIKELPSSIENLTALEVLNIELCKSLASLPSGIGELKHLKCLRCSGCSNLERFPEITGKMENLKALHLGDTAIEELPSSIENLIALEVLNIELCKSLASLPSGISELKHLKCLRCSGCSNLERFPEITRKMENLKELHLAETAIEELPSSIENLTALEVLYLNRCKSLASLPTAISELKHLKSLRCSGCSDLESFPEITVKMEHLKELHLDWTSIKELPSSIENLTALEVLNIELCKSLVSLPSGIGELKHLKCLRCSGCSNLERFPDITGKMENLKELHLGDTAIEELPSSIENLIALEVLNIELCKSLASLPSVISELKHLKCLRCSSCSNLERFPEITRKMENLKELHLAETAIEELPSSIENLTALEVLYLNRCKSLASLPTAISELKHLKSLRCSGCSDLESFPEITVKMEHLKELHLDWTSIKELPSSIENLTALEVLNIELCKSLASLPSGIGELKHLKCLRCSGCSNLERFPEITGKMENLKELHLADTAIEELPSSIENLIALEVLNIELCKSLASLPSCISELKHLKCLRCSGCSNLERFPEITRKMENLKELHLAETAIEELPSSIENLTALEVLYLNRCKSLASLPTAISELKHLKSLQCSGCSDLESFPEITGKMEHLKELHLDWTSIKELPSSIENLTALEVLNIELCKSLASLPSGIGELKHLKCLRCSGCSNLERFPDITGKMENLKELHLADTAIEELPSSIENLIALEVLNIELCKSLASLPSGISELKHLKCLRCSGCSNLERFPEITGKMENLKELHLAETAIEELPSSIENLTALEVLYLNRCKSLASLPTAISGLKHLKSLRCSGCSDLESFPEITGKMEHLKELHLDESSIKELPSSIENLTALEVLYLRLCKSLASLPSAIIELKNLKSLKCFGCPDLERFPEITGKMEHLKELRLDFTAIKELPLSIENLTALEVLYLKGCRSLSSLPSGISELKKLESLHCSGCSKLEWFPEITEKLENLKELHLDETAIEGLSSSIENLTALEVLNLEGCASLASLPSCISELKHLKSLRCSGCPNLKWLPEITGKMENLKELHLDWTAIKELPSSIENLIALEVLNLEFCRSLACLPSGISEVKHLKCLRCSGCLNLERFPEITGKMENLKELHLADIAIEELPSSIENLTALEVLYLNRCKSLASLPTAISELKHLKILRCSGCSNLESFPEITGKMEHLKELHLDWTSIKELPSSIENLTALEVLNIELCKSLANLPSGIGELKHLKCLRCSGCSNLERFPEITGKMENLKELHLDETAMKELPSSIENLTALEVLNLKGCESLASLPSCISWLKHLKSLQCSGCSKLETFPEIKGKMENLKELHLDETAIKELPSSIENLTALEVLDLARCKSLASLPNGISELKHLKSLQCSGCSNLERFPEIIGKMENLKELHLDETAIEELPSSIENLTALEVLNLELCESLASLPSGLSELKHLNSLPCSLCSNLDRFPEITGKMENLKELHLDWTDIKELPSSIENLTALKVLNLECCKSLASLPSGISELKNLESLLCFGCSKLERFPEITGEMENLKVLHLDRTAIKELPSSIEYLTALEVLNLELCESLASLPSGISELKKLGCLWCSGCSKLETFPEIRGMMENLKELHLDGTAIKTLPSSIGNLTALVVLNLQFCKSLASLPSDISELKHLKSLWCFGCSNLKRFPELPGRLNIQKSLIWMRQL